MGSSSNDDRAQAVQAARAARADNVREKVGAARLSVVSNTLIVLLKLAVGLWTGSVAILSEAVHSASDLVAAIIALFAVRLSDAPPDPDHPYGHGKFEAVSGAVEALLIVGAGIYIVIEAGRALVSGEAPRELGWAIGVMAATSLANALVARYLFAVARRTDSLALLADAHHLQTDVWTSLGVTGGLIIVRLTGVAWFDPLVALIVAGFIFLTAGRLLRSAFQPLTDAVLPAAEVGAVENVLRGNARVLGFHKLRSRKAGSQRHIDVHIQVEDDMSLRDAHQLTEELEDQMRDVLPNVEVMIHTEPYEEERRHHEEVPH